MATVNQSTIANGAGITMTTLYGMFARVLEQTTALSQAQASTNRLIEELRQSLSGSHKSGNIHECRCHVESPAGTVQHVDPRAPETDVQSSNSETTTLTREATPVGPNNSELGSGVPTRQEPVKLAQRSSDVSLPDPDKDRLQDRPDSSTTRTNILPEPVVQGGNQKSRSDHGVNIERVVNEVRKMKYKELLQAITADGERRNKEIIESLRATVHELVPFNVQAYLDRFSQTLSTEVRMLLGEVGQLYEERRNIQHEIGYLLTTQATLERETGSHVTQQHSSFSSTVLPPLPPVDPPASDISDAPERPAWRTIVPRQTRRRRRHHSPPPPPPAPALEPRQAQSWVAWQPNPHFAPTPPSVEPILLVPDRGSPGLFGPRSPRDSPNPQLVPTPPSVEPTLLVPDRDSGSPGLFGPRSPRDSTINLFQEAGLGGLETSITNTDLRVTSESQSRSSAPPLEPDRGGLLWSPSP